MLNILKFGGSSVGSHDGRASICRIVAQMSPTSDIIVVVSALGGVTDLLLGCAPLAASGDGNQYMELFDQLVVRHRSVVNQELSDNQIESVGQIIDDLLSQLKAVLHGVSLTGDISAKTTASIVAYGERLSSVIIAALLSADHIDARQIIKSRPYFGRHVVDFEQTNPLIRQRFAQHRSRVTVVGGFISSDQDNITTNLGRGGSDYTAAIVAAALGADQLYIYTDVDGFMTADPRIVSTALPIERLTFVEAMDLCNFGAKVIYAPTIFPAYNAAIPIIIGNTFNSSCKGTYITEHSSSGECTLRGISSISDTCLLGISARKSGGVIGINYRLFKSLSRSGITVFLVSQTDECTWIGIANSDADEALSTLGSEFAQQIAMGEIDDIAIVRNLATIALVGDGLSDQPSTMNRIFGSLDRAGINIMAVGERSSQNNISFVTELRFLRRAIGVLHDTFFSSADTELHLYVAGQGFVAKSLLSHIESQRDIIIERSGVKISINGVFDSPDNDHNSIFNQIVADALPNSVFVDCTASEDLASLYAKFLSHNISVVTANKIAASGDYDYFTSLKKSSHQCGVKFLFETNVGGGLPIIKTIDNLRQSGDTIKCIEAAVSGFINYILSSMRSGALLSQAVAQAESEGHTESDPRVDLDGTDVVRKMVILARQCGYKLDSKDVSFEPFLPGDLFDGDLEHFARRLKELDDEWQQRMASLHAQGKQIQLIATLRGDSCQIALCEVGFGSPFFNIDRANNVVLIHTARYREYPLQIKGYGYGASLTAEGVLADVMTLADRRWS